MTQEAISISTTPPLPGLQMVQQANAALQTVASDFAGPADPAALAGPYMTWADTTNMQLKRRNSANSAWVVEGALFDAKYDHGQCQFVYVSASECRLNPYNGNGLIINGKQYRIPNSGITLPIASVVGAAGSTNYVYAKDDGVGGISLETSLTGHSRHIDGIEIKTGDPTRTLVGVVYKNVSSQFQFDGSVPGVASWFNRYYPVGTGSDVNRSTVSNTPVPLIPGSNVWVWGGESVDLQANGFVSNNTAGGTCWLQLNLDGSQAWVGGHASSTANATGSVAPRASTQTGELSEGFHFVEMLVSVSPGSSGTFTLSQTIRANP